MHDKVFWRVVRFKMWRQMASEQVQLKAQCEVRWKQWWLIFCKQKKQHRKKKAKIRNQIKNYRNVKKNQIPSSNVDSFNCCCCCCWLCCCCAGGGVMRRIEVAEVDRFTVKLNNKSKHRGLVKQIPNQNHTLLINAFSFTCSVMCATNPNVVRNWTGWAMYNINFVNCIWWYL